MKTLTTLAVCLIVFLAASLPPAVASAQGGRGPHGGEGPCPYRGMPYGQYCPGGGWGPYGARKAVRTAEEAKQVVEAYFAPLKKGVRAGKIEERPLYFEVEIIDKQGVSIDKTIVDKRTGRIRSIY